MGVDMKADKQNGSVEADSAQARFASFAEPLVEDAAAQAAALRADEHAEVLHKLRVALRRLRSLLWAYRPLLDRALDDRQRAVFKDLAAAAGKTRDWDVAIELLGSTSDAGDFSVERLQEARGEALNSSRETLSHASINSELRDALEAANRELDALHQRTPLKQFARKRVESAERSLHKRMRRASRAKKSDYESYHEVRKAGKKVRYLLEFFEPMLSRKQLKSAAALKKLQKRFGALNDVVASEDLLRRQPEVFQEPEEFRRAMAALEKERKRRVRAAAKLLQ